ncbi:four-carbon acid sugar kinase family protein [Paenibacillus antri]|uniref:Four-carbon acid sugar kinase family protein n=1 Tax=Paenibacillus antri TaxID=2582848 RepID=A0A5R9GCU6_9BACL|nr:four-carbon acid sugar kinase family protein [Paenibacillus antri]TLS51900.1 four-carbon acid sugar kinase family protein [Paenibacillus antri]
MTTSPVRRLISFYGDDFTGSTDSMEALMLGGVKTALFLEPPTRVLLDERFPDIQGFGVAGVSRSMTPAEMERELSPVFASLRDAGTPIVHYKMCSTFDSSPDIGSIGKAAELGRAAFGGDRPIPILVGAPALKRYTVFGNHFATAGDDTFRLDRHPTMSRHPVTPMNEADLRLHLGKQTTMSIALMDLLDLDGEEERVRERLRVRLSDRPDLVLFDVLDEARLERAGGLIWGGALEGGRFVIGSSGVEYALTAHWRRQGLISPDVSPFRRVGPAKQLFAVSGSCSPVTEAQIRYALRNGFVGIPVDANGFAAPDEAEAYRRRLLGRSLAVLAQGGSPLLYTALGPDGLETESLKRRMEAAGRTSLDTGRMIGEQLGKLTREVIERTGLPRFLAAGGDTSGYVARELGIYALSCLMPIAPGGPLCLSYADDPRFDGKELALKGGQVGREDYFVRVLEGR